jgi:4-hydroxy-tetrahydrodipicolinate synthase
MSQKQQLKKSTTDMKKQALELGGIVTVLNTPFDDDDRVDLVSLKRNVSYALECGVVGFVVPGMASEVSKLSDPERRSIVDAVLEEVSGKAVVVGGASDGSARKRIAHTKDLVRAGCDGVMVSITYENDAQFFAHVSEVADVGPKFLMLQDWDRFGYGIPVPMIVKLFDEVEAFRSLKIEVVPAGVKYSEVLKATGGALHLAGGWAVGQLIEGLDRGVNAFMPTGMHEIYVRIYTLYHRGDREAAKQLFYRLLPVLAFTNQDLDISIHFLKQLLFEQGIYATSRVRQPVMHFDAHHERITSELIDHVRRLCAEVEETS